MKTTEVTAVVGCKAAGNVGVLASQAIMAVGLAALVLAPRPVLEVGKWRLRAGALEWIGADAAFPAEIAHLLISGHY